MGLMQMLEHPRVTVDDSGWPHRIYSGIDWSIPQSNKKGEHLHWVCTLCNASFHGSRVRAVIHAGSHDREWDAASQCLLTKQ
jgi:hypothetical protein